MVFRAHTPTLPKSDVAGPPRVGHVVFSRNHLIVQSRPAIIPHTLPTPTKAEPWRRQQRRRITANGRDESRDDDDGARDESENVSRPADKRCGRTRAPLGRRTYRTRIEQVSSGQELRARQNPALGRVQFPFFAERSLEARTVGCVFRSDAYILVCAYVTTRCISCTRANPSSGAPAYARAPPWRQTDSGPMKGGFYTNGELIRRVCWLLLEPLAAQAPRDQSHPRGRVTVSCHRAYSSRLEPVPMPSSEPGKPG